MKYSGMPAGMWLLFGRPFRRQLETVLGFDSETAGTITEKAKRNYREIITSLPEFETGDRFKMNIVSCAMLAAFYLQMKPKPSLEKMTAYYNAAMMTGVMRRFCRMSARRKFSAADIEGMRKTALFRAADRNPYSWNMELLPYSDGSGYEARFSHCGICTLMKELGIYEVVPAMCALDYAMSDAGGRDVFVRQHTLAVGGPYCDCGYKKKV